MQACWPMFPMHLALFLHWSLLRWPLLGRIWTASLQCNLRALYFRLHFTPGLWCPERGFSDSSEGACGTLFCTLGFVSLKCGAFSTLRATLDWWDTELMNKCIFPFQSSWWTTLRWLISRNSQKVLSTSHAKLWPIWHHTGPSIGFSPFLFHSSCSLRSFPK